jgi:alkyldihydroxyacetonephosphate synthase
VPWNKVRPLLKNVEAKVREECMKLGVEENKVLYSARVTQMYETGATVYVYWGLNYLTNGIKLEDAVPLVEHIEHSIRMVMIANGGSISHHHGVGKLKKPFQHLAQAPANL